MAQIKKPLYGSGPVQAGEQRLLDYLEEQLPDDYVLIPNGEFTVSTHGGAVQTMEYDCIVVAPHAVYHIENKDYAAPIQSDDFSWTYGGRCVSNPIKGATYKTKLLRGWLINKHPEWKHVKFDTLITLSHPGQNKFGFDPYAPSTRATFILNRELTECLTDNERLEKAVDAIEEYRNDIVEALTGLLRQSSKSRTEVVGYKIISELDRNENYTEWLCEKKSLIGESRQYRIKEYPMDVSGLNQVQIEQRKYQINNGNLAQDLIGHSNYILPSQYQMNDEGTFFYEITEDLGLRSLKHRMVSSTMTLMAKIKIIQDVAQALKAAHAVPVYHRNVSPENICISADGEAALTNFNQSWFLEHTTAGAGGFTVKSQILTDASPYCPPEFADDDVCEASDLFSLGVVAYRLLTGKLPFESTAMFKAIGKLTDDKMPTKVVPELPEWIDELVRRTIALNVEDRFESAEQLIDFIGANAFPKAPNSQRDQHRQKTLKEMKPGDMVNPNLQLYEELGSGGFGRVFKAKNTVTGKLFAVKLFEFTPSAIDDATREYGALEDIQHHNIVNIHDCGKSNDGLFYTQMELLEGENLSAYTKGDLRLPLPEIFKMLKEILSALVYMQDRDPVMYHRDIKPNNIVWDKKDRYVLIDFGIATDSQDNSNAGTRPYMAPDLAKSSTRVDWDKSGDTFSLGVTLYELLTHNYPWPGTDPCPKMMIAPTDLRKVSSQDFSDDFVNFVMKSIITDNTRRFKTAKEMLDALLAIGMDGMLKPKDVTVITHQGEIDIVDYINSLYSQSEHGNSGTRAAVKPLPLDELTYTETKLDKKLLGDIAALKYKLVIITGNAGDGKTAFLHKVENTGTDIDLLPNANGAKFKIKGIPFESNYDGSQDEEEKVNDDVLTDFFRPFMEIDDYTHAAEGRVIAINEGRLVDFLSTRPELKKLQENIEDYFYNEGHTQLLPGLMVINLNLRSVTACTQEGESLLRSQIKKLTSPILWSKCEGCPIADKCFIKYNVDTLNDVSAGDEVIKRLEWLLRTIVYKRELHITMRDLRSFIAFLLTRDYNCDQVKSMIEHIKADQIAPEFYWQFYYFNVTAPAFSYKGIFPFPTNNSVDRLVLMLKDTDIARVALPSLDQDLFYMQRSSQNYLMFGSRKQSLLDEFNTQNIILPYYMMSDDEKFLAKERHASMIRHQYFEGQWTNEGYLSRLPYQSINDFYRHLSQTGTGDGDKCKSDIAVAISKSEGCLNDELSCRYMLLACSQINDPLSKSYRMFPLDEFELFVNETPHLTEYIEYESDSLTFRHKRDHDIELTVSLDLFDMLHYIRKGFSPSINDLQGRFIELQIFKNKLESKTYKEILVTKNNKKFFIIRLNDDKTLSIDSFKQPQS